MTTSIYKNSTTTMSRTEIARRHHKAVIRNRYAGATSRPDYRRDTIEFYEKQLADVMAVIVESDPDLAGDLAEEFQIRETIAMSKAAGFARPELKTRLKAITVRNNR